MSEKYQIKHGQILREGVLIATRDDATGTIDYLPDMDKYRAPVSAFLREQGLDKPPAVPPEVAARMAKPKYIGTDAAAPEVPEPAGAPALPAVPQPPPRGSDRIDTPVEQAAPALLTDKDRRIAELEAQLAAARTAPAPVPYAPPALAPGHDLPAFGAVPGFISPGFGNAPMDPVKLRTYPDAPKYGPEGDKTPAFVDWLWENHPQDAERRYFGRKTHRG